MGPLQLGGCKGSACWCSMQQGRPAGNTCTPPPGLHSPTRCRRFRPALPDRAPQLQGSAREAAARRDELLVAARRLATELRGLDLLAGHVKAVHELVKRLEGQVEQVAGVATLHRQQQQQQSSLQHSPRQVQQQALSPPRQ